ncbi:MAG: protein translocase subunit SecF [Peptococcaceae bacterium]|jgi:preprotein translocase subunit SecF|nr:protein translocase subunit SecF [Peptococcaceae bacterium]MDH7525127.1 protein translocase subunit SecF [Peptococcaceae bacterium]
MDFIGIKGSGIDFIGRRRIWYIISAALIVIGLISLFTQGLNFGIDFKGGSLIQVKFNEAGIKTGEVRQVLGEFGLENSSIQEASDGSIVIKTVEIEQDKLGQVLKAFEEKLGKYDLLRSEKVGPVIGAELRRAGILALVIASILQIIYITIRFEFKFAVAAILALLHDAFMAIGFFSLFQFEVDSSFIAAVLTIIGYSINDTIVIFDRIRENLKNRRKESLQAVINNSINQTLARSINTVLAVVFVLVALLVLGGETTKNFSLALLVGVVSGAYSSICVASPLWYQFKPEEHGKAKTA